MFDIVFSHRDFIIINKPCAISVHKDDQETGLTTLLARQLGKEKLWLVHRLDKITSGLLIFALNVEAARELSRLFAEHRIHKTYLALSDHKPHKKQGTIIGDMKKARAGAWKLLRSREQPAITRFYSLSIVPCLRLFVLKPQTGKTHQIRVAMKSLGSPILGDSLYGNKVKTDRTYLHAFKLAFEYLGQPIVVSCLPQQGEHWQQPEVAQQILSLIEKT
ncbi:tRNA pseudouridine32 synthase/23S rRNA pseudouridine746 synthase [Volucribacter psittacicida]|uniref:tRNA pseudouridine32 synthase/23S rRNA pseudouridine746 synthase n=1 Tax=Volucribacter psittacicida TaxID=203482 RepID=A0A4R1G590_9PAST|nr:TIGR01621 family pseudouridine synthase [Volucribacter psittacicida]TCK01585.1 tRNA pseudouridine32 synthase/23S rRNA pseudouridine746 synthase [Volucribacter psittacicida]